MRSKRYQGGSLQKRKHGRSKKWVLLYWENGHRRYKTLGAVSRLTHAEAMGKKREFMDTINSPGPTRGCEQTIAFGEFVQTVFLPFCRRKWKESTTGTTEQRIKHHLVRDLGGALMQTMSRIRLQEFLEQKAGSGLSFSVVDHLRWDLRAIFELALEDRLVDRNPAGSLVTPAHAKRAAKPVMTAEQVQQALAVLDVRERLIASIAIFAGLRPGEIFGLKWRHIRERGAVVEQRIYRGKIGTPKTQRSVRTPAFGPRLIADLEAWRSMCPDVAPEAWVFPSEGGLTPLGKDNC